MAEESGETINTNHEGIRIHLTSVLNFNLRLLESENVDENILDGLQCRLDWLYNTVVRYVDFQIVDERVVECIREARECLLQRNSDRNLCSVARTERVFTGEKGRPRLQIPFGQLEFLLERKFKIAEIAKLFGTSKRTVERRLVEFGLSARAVYTSLSNPQLDEVISTIQRDFPNVGCKRVTGLLRARGVYMQQSRIRQSMRRVDPEGTLLRALELNIVHRRWYSVASPLSLWHIDGNHKLIRYVEVMK